MIRTKDGLETNCGHDCGRREFGVEFEEVEARAKRLEELQARRRAAMDVVLQAPGWLERLRLTWPLVATEEARLAEFTKDFKERSSFWSQLHKLAKGSGVVRAPTWTEHGLRDEVLGRIEGCTLLNRSLVWSSQTIKERHVPWLASLSAETVSKIDQTALDEVIKRSEQVQRVLREAPTFIDDVQKFLHRKNFELFDQMCMRGVCRPGKEGWGDLIRKWTGQRSVEHVPSLSAATSRPHVRS